MARIVLDPDEVNQAAVVTMTDGTVVTLAQADRATLDRIARQLHVHRSAYAHALTDPAVGDRVAAGDLPVEQHAPLFLHVARLQAASQPGPTRAPRALDLAVLLQERTWTSSSGTTRALTSLTPTHREHLCGWLKRHSGQLAARATAEWTPAEHTRVSAATPWVAGTPLYRRLRGLIDAQSAREQAMDNARQVARHLEFERSGDWPDR